MVLQPKNLPQPFTNITAIDFDDVPNAKVINTRYASKGVTFASITTNPQRHGMPMLAKTPMP